MNRTTHNGGTSCRRDSDRGRFEHYREYRQSGDECLGEIPDHWSARRLKHLLAEPLKYGANESAELDDPDLPRFIRITDIDDNGSLRPSTFKSLPEEVARPYLLQDGDLLYARSGATVGKTFLYRSTLGLAAYAGYLIRARFRADAILPRFVYYFNQSDQYWNWLNSIFIQATIQNVSAEKYAGLVVPFPPLPEQRGIVDFLDRETARIDALVTKKRRLIELLEEKRTALISHAVTKGLDPNAPTKPSGVEWFDDIPRHWTVKPLKHVVPKITVGIVITPAKFYEQEGVPCLRSLNISSQRIDKLGELVFISSEANVLHRKSIIREGDIVIVRTGRTGAAALVTQDFDGANCVDLVIVRRSEQGSPPYLHYYINSLPATRQVEALSVGSLQAHYNTRTVGDLVVPLPPKEEQHRILDYLKRTTGHLERLAGHVQAAIDQLQEYRTALISAAVTGKIDVRGHTKEAASCP